MDDRGALTDFSTTDRYGRDPAGPDEMVQARWSTPMRGWTRVDGRPMPIGGQAVWHFPSGDFAYADFRIAGGGGIEFSVSPGEPGGSIPDARGR